MKYKMSIILFLLLSVTKTVFSQDDLVWVYEKQSTVDTILINMEQSKKTIDESLIVFDSLFHNGKIDNKDFLSIGEFLLTLKDPMGYKMLLSNFTKFQYTRIMSPMDVMLGGKFFVIDIAIKAATVEELKSFVNYLFNSNYLDQKVSEEELRFVRKMFSYFKHEYRMKYDEREFSVQKEVNFEFIFNS